LLHEVPPELPLEIEPNWDAYFLGLKSAGGSATFFVLERVNPVIVNMQVRLRIGTEVLQPMSPFGPYHKAPVVGYTPNGEEVVLDHPKGKQSHFRLLRDLAAEGPTFIGEAGPASLQERAVIQARAFQAAGKPFDLLRWNCEHSSTFVRKGNPESPQLKFWGGVAAVAGFLYLLTD
jgi:hypothetical protein